MPGSQAAFERPLRTADDTAVPVRITQTTGGTELSVAVHITVALSATDEELIQSQVNRPACGHLTPVLNHIVDTNSLISPDVGLK